MENQHESDLIKRLEQLGIEVDVSPTVITITYEQIYTSGPTLEEAVVSFWARHCAKGPGLPLCNFKDAHAPHIHEVAPLDLY